MVTLVHNMKRRVKRKDLAVVFGWSALVSMILLYNFHSFHQENPFTMGAYGSPSFTDLDKLTLLITGFVVGFILPDIKKLIYGYFTSMTLAFFIGVGAVFTYIWYIFQLGQIFQGIPFGWETALFSAIVKVFGFMIPIGVLFSLMGIVTGNVLSLSTKYF
jgi:hypothetical protein